MNGLVNKEQKLYSAIQSNSHSASTFLTAFADYFGFLVLDGFELIQHLTPAVVVRQKKLQELELKYGAIVTDVGKALVQLTEILEKHKIQNNPVLDDRVSCLRTFASHNHHGSYDRPFGSNDLELLDALKELQRLGYEKDLQLFLNDTYNPEKGIRIENLIAFEKQNAYLRQHTSFHEQDLLSVPGALMRAVKLYHQMQKFADDTQITEAEFVDMTQDSLARVAYKNKLGVATLSTTNAHPREGISQDLSRIHDSIAFNLSEAKQAKLFEIKQEHIYFMSSKLQYKLTKQGNDYQYIELFKNVIRYMPEGVIELNINEFIKSLPDGVENDSEKYRTQLVGINTSFGKLLAKHKIINSHPNDNQSIFNITRTSIRFNNLYSLE